MVAYFMSYPISNLKKQVKEDFDLQKKCYIEINYLLTDFRHRLAAVEGNHLFFLRLYEPQVSAN